MRRGRCEGQDIQDTGQLRSRERIDEANKEDQAGTSYLSGYDVLDGHEELLRHVEGYVAQTHDGGAEVWAVEAELFLNFLQGWKQWLHEEPPPHTHTEEAKERC